MNAAQWQSLIGRTGTLRFVPASDYGDPASWSLTVAGETMTGLATIDPQTGNVFAPAYLESRAEDVTDAMEPGVSTFGNWFVALSADTSLIDWRAGASVPAVITGMRFRGQQREGGATALGIIGPLVVGGFAAAGYAGALGTVGETTAIPLSAGVEVPATVGTVGADTAPVTLEAIAHANTAGMIAEGGEAAATALATSGTTVTTTAGASGALAAVSQAAGTVSQAVQGAQTIARVVGAVTTTGALAATARASGTPATSAPTTVKPATASAVTNPTAQPVAPAQHVGLVAALLGALFLAFKR